MCPAIDDVHHGHRQGPGVGAAHITIEWQPLDLCRSAGHGQGDPEQGVGPQAGLVLSAVDIDQDSVDSSLVPHIQPHEMMGDLLVYVGHSPADTLAHPGLSTIPKLHGFMRSRRGPGGHNGPARVTVVAVNFHLHGGIAARVQNKSGVDVEDRGHVHSC